VSRSRGRTHPASKAFQVGSTRRNRTGSGKTEKNKADEDTIVSKIVKEEVRGGFGTGGSVLISGILERFCPEPKRGREGRRAITAYERC